ncbi:MAG: 4-hydroxythreonine-4-phosphate dehydrogenase PdxA [Hyphomicrobiaceae bacterium]|nr:4-hydroxythreonine-4-phosphate dehydrogenase PdxA [Hyphomicrobiaceae bacterium]
MPLAVTMGDPAGIGLDIVIEAWRGRQASPLPPFVLYADPDSVAARSAVLGVDIAIAAGPTPRPGSDFPADAITVRPIPLAVPAVPGRADTANAGAVITAIDTAVADVVAGSCAAIVTNPISKATLYAAGFEHPGHTEYLAALAARHVTGRRWTSVMMLAADVLRVVPMTVHIPLAAVPAAVTRERIDETVRIVASDLKRWFAIDRPRIAVAGLNPHAGEGGSIGREEIEVIAPAIAALRAEGFDIVGPLSGDTMFHETARSRYDVAICMYHDQALIPLKTLAFDDGVNVTLGLPFIRTSPDHGTAFDIAGTGAARPTSLVAAMRLAARMAAVPASADRIPR